MFPTVDNYKSPLKEFDDLPAVNLISLMCHRYHVIFKNPIFREMKGSGKDEWAVLLSYDCYRHLLP